MFDFVHRLLGTQRPTNPTRLPDIDFRTLAENSNDVIVRCGKDGIATYVSPSSLRLFGKAPQEMIGKSHLDFVVPEDLPALRAAGARHVAGDPRGLVVFRVRRTDGALVWVEGSGKSVIDPETGDKSLVIVMRDITERKEAEQKLAELALTDGLTGLPNRRAFDVGLNKEWHRSQQTQSPLSLLLLDVDQFKAFNDDYGHQAGDECLRVVASTIQEVSRREGDIAARYGGEEFAVILPKTVSSHAVTIAETIRTAVEKLRLPHKSNIEGGGFCTISVGAACAPSKIGGSVQMPAGLLQAADVALYKAKQQGRNRTEVDSLLTSNEGSTSVEQLNRVRDRRRRKQDEGYCRERR